MASVYLTIWLALCLFTAGEVGRARAPHRAGWPWIASVSGLTLSLVHTILSFGIVHGWSHDAAVQATAVQTQAVFGASVGWGVYVNYVFFLTWAVDLAWWKRSHGVTARPQAATLALRSFYFIIMLNAAVIFAAGWRRFAGGVMIFILLSAWARLPRTVGPRPGLPIA
jgi:hypothetical protein